MKILAVLSLLFLGSTFQKFDFYLNEEFVVTNYQSKSLNVTTIDLGNGEYNILFIQQGYQIRAIKTHYITKRGIVVQYEKRAKLI
jgi:hypothetical protein